MSFGKVFKPSFRKHITQPRKFGLFGPTRSADPEKDDYELPEGVQCILPGWHNEYNIDNFRDPDPAGSSPNVQSGALRTVIGVFFPADSRLVADFAAVGPGPSIVDEWSENQIRQYFGVHLQQAIKDWTFGTTTLVGGNYAPQVDAEFVGPLPGDLCNNTNPPDQSQCACSYSQAGYLRTNIKDWFNNNGYTNSDYEVKIAVILGCSNDISPNGNPDFGLGGTASIDPLVYVYMNDLNKTSSPNLPPFPPADLGISETFAGTLLGDGHVQMVTAHEVLHSIGYTHDSNFYGGSFASVDCAEEMRLYGPTFGAGRCTCCSYSYGGRDNLSNMAWDASPGRNNHRVALDNGISGPDPLKRNLMGSLAGSFHEQNAGAQHLPDANAPIIDLSPGESWSGFLYAVDRKFDDPRTQDILATGKNLLLKLTRNVPMTQRGPCDQEPAERYYALYYRKKAWYAKTDPYTNGALLASWGPARNNTGITGCAASNNWGACGMGKWNAEVSPPGTSTITLAGYVANGVAFPTLDITISENTASAGDIGPDRIGIFIQAS